MIRQYELLEKVKAYDPAANEDILNRAYVYAMKAHGSQMRASGDPYFSHPLEVAGILSDLKLDASSIAAGLLHDTLEDTETTPEELKRLFGDEITHLVDGVTKLSRLEIQSEQSQQAENFRKLLLASSKDIRVLLIKLADRLHNMRTLHHLKDPEKRKRKAAETMEIYAPLAERIGTDDIKNELQDLAFKELHADARASILARLEFLRTEEGNVVENIINELKQTLSDHGITAEISGREKTPYSIWFKMQKKNISFEQLADIMAFRIFVDDVPKCYQALGILHSKYSVVPGRFKDYISTPKPNGYRSIHTVIVGPESQKIEIQIRTHEMHEIAEHGVAAHWSYKQGGKADANKDGQQYRWLRELLDILEQAEGPQEFLEHTKLEMFEDRVFCFTPTGEVVELPKNATPVDFAYAVHSLIGDRCVGARVNGRIVPLKTPLQNGDQVEILTSKTQTPSPAWEQFVVTGKAKARIRRFIRTQKRTEYIDLGRSMLQRAFRKEGYVYNDKAVENVLKVLNIQDLEELFAQVGEGRKPAREVLMTVYPSLRTVDIKKDEDYTVNKTTVDPKHQSGIPIKGMIPGMAFRLAKCCHPLPGDRIVGIMTTGRGVTIHTIDCDTLQNFKESPERWLDISWTGENKTEENHVARIAVVMQNEAGGFGTLGTVIAKNDGLIHNLRITNRTPDFFEMIVDVEVRDIKHLNNVIAALRATTAITSVERIKHS